ncbi:hypothetical protein BVG16_13540 [Paenibacillus selenitireducens]|uniref:Uncharacterized protein n=1 Tax=Paenibacillus selenitireducens TaxID=1324314 RepID=A0A1T2XCY6_9BACL|nr:hypothetical protein [Paenibacillus selenitireducens]OPA77473.1 hypothetical protein BVG16_13540 [Paenibacillus selenitireducens]
MNVLNISNFLATSLLNQVFRNTNYARPTTVYVALYTSNPTAADTGAEVSTGAYKRMAITLGAPVIENSKQTIKNSADVAWSVATADWGLVSHIGIRDALTGGNLLYFGSLDTPRSILVNDVFKLLTGSVVLTLS